MPSLWFIVPAHGRAQLASICLRQLRRTCDALVEEGIDATAVVIADDENLDTARDLGFATIWRANDFVSAKYNDGIQLACDPEYNPRPADYVVPCGSDDWVDYRLFLDLPPADTMVGFQRLSFVREDGKEMVQRFVDVRGGCGIRIYPREIVAMLGYRPADEDRRRACDTSIITNLWKACRFKVVHRELDPRQIVDWKSPDVQLNPYESLTFHKILQNPQDPFTALADLYPEDALREMKEHYAQRLVAA
jgi:hypothetical protein